MLKKCLTAILLTLLLAAGSCNVAGDFCDVVHRPIEFTDPATAQTVVATDRQTVAEPLSVLNSYGRVNCPGPLWQ